MGRKKKESPAQTGLSPMYFGYEDKSKKPTRDKILYAIEAYNQRHPKPAKFCLISTKEEVEEPIDGIELLPRTYIQKGVYYVGREPW